MRPLHEWHYRSPWALQVLNALMPTMPFGDWHPVYRRVPFFVYWPVRWWRELHYRLILWQVRNNRKGRS